MKKDVLDHLAKLYAEQVLSGQKTMEQIPAAYKTIVRILVEARRKTA